MYKSYLSTNSSELTLGSSIIASEVSLTLISSKNWEKNHIILDLAKLNCGFLSQGQLFTCTERFGGNTLNLLYPYIHLSIEPFVIKERLRNAISFKQQLPHKIEAKLDQGLYEEIGRFSSGFDSKKFSVLQSDHFIFIGVRININDWDESTEKSWQSWSKIDILTESLTKSGISLIGVSCLRQIEPNNTNLFMYCFIVSLNLSSNLLKIKCLNVLQRLRGTLIPGYVSLFEKSKGSLESLEKKQAQRKHNLRYSRSEESLNNLLKEIERSEGYSLDSRQNMSKQSGSIQQRNSFSSN